MTTTTTTTMTTTLATTLARTLATPTTTSTAATTAAVGHRLAVAGLTKRYRGAAVVDDLTFSVEPGRVTGFLGPNGSGKSTTMKLLLGLAAPDAGTATIDGVRYRDLDDPAGTVGVVLEPNAFHPGRFET